MYALLSGKLHQFVHDFWSIPIKVCEERNQSDDTRKHVSNYFEWGYGNADYEVMRYFDMK